MPQFARLFEPLKINAMVLKNRIVLCPMGTNLADRDGMPTDRMAGYYGERARGGTGLIIVEQTPVHPAGKWSKLSAGLWDDASVPHWRKVVNAVHAWDAKIAIQIGHLGRSTNLDNTGGLQPVAPSPIPCHLANTIPHELTTEEVYAFIEDYMRAVRRALDAGFDAIEIHGTHGYLIASFMSGKTNKRTDEFGGTLRGRLRLPLELIRRVREEAGESYPVLMRIGSVEPKGGRQIEETKVIARILTEAGLDALDVSAGTFTEVEWEVPPYYFPPGFNLMNIEAIKRSVDVPVICSGLVHEPDFAEQVLAEGRCDLVGIGRALIADPFWAKKAEEGRDEEIHHCIACTRCIDALFTGGLLKCTVNPMVGREGELEIERAPHRKRVVVVGGGPAGLEAAVVAARRGHEVTLLEKELMLGGQVRTAAIPPDKYLISSVIRWLETEAGLAGVDIRKGVKAGVEEVGALRPDAVVVATGGKPLNPGFGNSCEVDVVHADDVLMGRVETGVNVLIIGGGAVGCETAHFLAEYGKSITVVEMLDRVGADLGFIPGPILLDKLKRWSVRMLSSTKVLELTGSGAAVLREGRQETLSGFDTIVLALGYAPVRELFDALKERFPESYVVGDASHPRDVMAALEEGVEVGLKI